MPHSLFRTQLILLGLLTLISAFVLALPTGPLTPLFPPHLAEIAPRISTLLLLWCIVPTLVITAPSLLYLFWPAHAKNLGIAQESVFGTLTSIAYPAILQLMHIYYVVLPYLAQAVNANTFWSCFAIFSLLMPAGSLINLATSHLNNNLLLRRLTPQQKIAT